MWILIDISEPHQEDNTYFMVRDIFEEKPTVEESEIYKIYQDSNVINDRSLICWIYYNPQTRDVLQHPAVNNIRPIGEIPISKL